MLYAVQLGSMMVLARLFTPEQFGYIAAVQVFSIFFILLSEVGIAPAFINKKVHKKDETDGIFTVTGLIGLAICLLFIFLAPAIADFYNDELYIYIVIPSALAVVFSGFSVIPTASLQLDCRFITIARCEVKSEIISLVLSLALMNFIDPVIALSLKFTLFSFFKFLFLWFSSKKTSIGSAGLSTNFKAIKPLMNFSMYQFGFNFVNYFSRNLDNILVGKYVGANSLGIYDQAYKIMRYPLMLLTFAITPAIQPMMKTIAHDNQHFLKMHNKFFNYISLVGLLVGILVLLFSDLIVLILLGKGWEEVSNIIKMLSLSIPVQIVMSTSGGFFQASGKVKALFYSGVLTAAINVTSIVLGVMNGNIVILALFISIAFQLNFFISYYIFSKFVLNIYMLDFVKEIKVFVIANFLYVCFVLFITKDLFYEVLF